MSKEIQQLLRYVVVGCSAVITDAIIYYILIKFISPVIAKSVSFLTGTIVSYFLNKFWTFESSGYMPTEEIMRFLILYISTFSLNILINYVILLLLPEIYWLAFIAATGTSTILNFIGQKWWVFKNVKTFTSDSLL